MHLSVIPAFLAVLSLAPASSLAGSASPGAEARATPLTVEAAAPTAAVHHPTASSASAPPSPARDLESRLRARIAEAPGEVGLAFVDLGTGLRIGLGDTVRMHAASTMKVPVMLELYRQAEAGGPPIDGAMVVRNAFTSIADGSGYALSPDDDSDAELYARVGGPVELRDLIDRMITRSSNLATNLLIERADPDRIRATLEQIGAGGMEVLRGVEDIPAFRRGLNNTTTAEGLARVLEYLARCERGEDARLGISREACAEMTAILAGQEFVDKIPAGLPEGVRVANKTGWITGIDHDGAIVYPPGRAPYVLVVLTRGIEDRDEARRTAADLSRIVWETLAGSSTAAPTTAPAFSIEEVLAPAFPYGLVAARAADRIAWLEYEAGARNVYTAAAPDFRPVRLTDNTEDDGVDLSGLQISDDGAVVMFIRGHAPNRDGWVANPASDADGAERAAWAVRTSGGPAWRIAEAWDPVLSPDGRWIAYTRDGQIHRAPVDPSHASVASNRASVSSGRAPVSADTPAAPDPDETGPAFIAFGENDSPVWSPDSRRIAFVSRRETHAFVGVYDMEAHTVRYMAPSVDHDGAPAWSPDGTRVAFIRRPGTPFNPPPRLPWWLRSLDPDTVLPDGMTRAGFEGGHTLELWTADARTGHGERLWHSWPQDERFTDVNALDWVGDHIVFRSEPGEWEGHRFAVSVTSPAREPVELTSRPGFVEHVAYSADGRWIYYSANTGDVDRRHLWRAPIAGGEPEPITRGTDIETFPAVLASGDRVALLRAGAREPQHVAIVDAAGGEPRAITRAPESFPRAAHVVPENVVITAEDGLSFHSQLFLPPDLRPGERRPALIFIHGGPRRQMLLGYNYGHFYHMAYAMNQYFASQGYVVLSINFRSGIGYGTAFRDIPDYGRRGSSEYQDVLAAGRYLQQRADVDAERVGLWGLSYGGILTALGLARNSDIFKAGVDIAGVHLYGDADDPESTLYRASAVADIDRWTSPVLLIHGDDDRNVAFSQTVGLVQLLRARGIPHELIVYPDEVHVFLVHRRWIEAFRATDAFLERHLRQGRGTVN